MFKLKIDTLYSYINTLKLTFCKNKHDDTIFSLAKMIADIILYVISKAGTLPNFGTFLICFFWELKFVKILKKFSATLSVIKYTIRPTLQYLHNFLSLYMYSP